MQLIAETAALTHNRRRLTAPDVTKASECSDEVAVFRVYVVLWSATALQWRRELMFDVAVKRRRAAH